MYTLGFFGSHNSNIAIAKDDKILEVVEVERFISVKNAGLFYYCVSNMNNPLYLIREIKKYFEKKYGVEKYEVVVFNSVDNEAYLEFPAKQYKFLLHHLAHAHSGFYQSPFQSALVISFDGGSDEGYFNIYTADKQRGIDKIYSGSIDYAVSYMLLGHHIQDIKHERLGIGNLVYAGKLMGYAGYGTVQEEYISKFTQLYTANVGDNFEKRHEVFLEIFQIDKHTKFTGELAKNLAATNQYVFEQLFLKEVTPFLEKYHDLPIVMVGGCALNILNNTKLAKSRTIFVPPNPNDCGLSIGLVSSVMKPSQIDATYIGPEVWDRHELGRVIYDRNAKELNISEVTNFLINGKIVGVVRDRCEHGPRALGNRSILCNPSIKYMKDILNAKVKGREYYRPFAPVVRLEDVSKYFEWEGESRWMSFCPKVREQYKEQLSAIVHVDGTARVQTVTETQNKFLYDVLTEMHNKTGMGVLLNTSFNIDGKPILNTYKEALWLLDNKDMDAIVIENYFIYKKF